MEEIKLTFKNSPSKIKYLWNYHKPLVIVFSILIILAIIFLALFLPGINDPVFPERTYIEGVDVSGKTPKESSILISEEFNRKEFKIVDAQDTNKVLGTLTNFGFQYSLEDKIQSKVKWASFLSKITSIFGMNTYLSVDVIPEKPTEIMLENIKKLDFVNDDKLVKTENAHVDMSSREFPIVPEVYGTSVDVDKLGQAVVAEIASKNWQLEYTPSEFYELPTVKKDNEDLITRQKYCKKNLAQIITYDLCDEKYDVTVEDLDSMLTQKGEDGVINKEGVEKFVSKLCDKANTVGMSRKFKTTKHGKLSVSGGTYGYSVSYDDEVNKLIEDIQTHKNVEREPVYGQEGARGKGNLDIGDTYIELDLDEQTVYFYRNGELLSSSKVVTGCVKDGSSTPRGVYYVFAKQRDAKLKGENKDKTEYETPVDYWMPFTSGGIGFHDAKWRKEFGKDIYIKDGSHGCVNMPLSYAKALYNAIDIGIPVVIY